MGISKLIRRLMIVVGAILLPAIFVWTLEMLRPGEAISRSVFVDTAGLPIGSAFQGSLPDERNNLRQFVIPTATNIPCAPEDRTLLDRLKLWILPTVYATNCPGT